MTTPPTLAAARGSWQQWHSPEVPLRLGVSACLLGDEVRFDGGHARARFVRDVLGRWFEFTRVCPEVEVGMGIPRPTVRLVEEDDAQGPRMVAPSTGEDWTARMEQLSARRARELGRVGLDGFVLKKDSPSCGMERIRVYRKGHVLRKTGRGLFAAALLAADPGLPVEEEGRLNDPRLRENFIERVFCRNRWRALLQAGVTRRRLVEFHTAHKLLLRAHDERGYRALGRLVGEAGQRSDAQLRDAYEAELVRTLAVLPTARKHANVLQHAMGYLKDALEPGEKRELLAAIEDFRVGMLPLVVPLTLLRFNIVKHGVEYLAGQLYFEPHPKELMLRNHC